MTLSSAFRLYPIFLLFSCCWLMGCKEEIFVQKAPSTFSAGIYQLTGTTAYTINGAVSSSPVSGTLTVFAGPSADSYYFRERTASYQIGYLATLRGSNFTVEAVQENARYQNTTYFGLQSGGGKVSADQVEIDRYSTPGLVGFIAPTGEYISYTATIRKHVHLKATRLSN